MINFPNSPANGDTHTEGGKTWRYNGSAWVGVGSTTISWANILGKPTFGSAAYTEASAYASSAQGTKADTASQPGHLHSIADVTGLQDALDAASGGSTVITNDLDRMFTSARATYYHELIYTSGGDVGSIEVYTDSTKATHLYTRTFTYDSNGNISTVVTTDLQNAGLSLTKTITYNGAGNITSVNRNYTL